MDQVRASRRDSIVRATAGLFREKGYDGTSMAEIGAAVGLEKGSLYSHISAKHDVLRELVERGARLFMDGLSSVLAMDAGPEARVRAALQVHLSVIAQHPDLAAVFLHEWRRLDAPDRARVVAMRDSYEAMWREIVDQGRRAGVFRPDIDAQFAALLLLSAANWAAQWFDPEGRLSSDEVADRFADLALGGMRVMAPPRPSSSGG